MLDKGKLNHSRVSIVQAYDLKKGIEELKIKIDEVTIASVDAINMYPSIKISTIKKAVIFFARKLIAETKKIINLCLELIHFRMSSTLISFGGEYYKYHEGEIEEQWLAIGGYESEFLADLVASYLFEKSKSNFHPTTYHRIYIDDGLVVFTVNKSARGVKYWLEEFQQTVNKAAVNQHLQFTAEIWTTEDNSPTPAKEDKGPNLDERKILIPRHEN